MAIGSAVAWGLTQSYWVEAQRAPLTVRAERGCLIVRHESPIALAWSPNGAIEKAEQSIDRRLGMASGRVTDRLQRVESKWDPTDEIRFGFILPRWRVEPEQADFDLGVGWNRNQVILPIWLIVMSAWLLSCVLKRNYAMTVMKADILPANQGFGNVPCPNKRHGCTRLLLQRGFIVVSLALSTWGSGYYLFGEAVFTFDDRLATNLKILAQPDTQETSWNVNNPGLEPVIVGSDAFHRHISEGIGLLKVKDAAGYRLLIGNVGRIYQGDTTLAHPSQSPPSIEIDLDRYYSSMISFAGTLVHEACHCKLARLAAPFGMSSDTASAGTEAELACIQVEIQTLRTLGAPHWEIASLESADGTHWKHYPRKYEH